MGQDQLKFIKIDDFKMRVRIVDHSPRKKTQDPLILVMGYRGHLGWWPEEFIQHCARKQKVILLDNRAAGKSTRGIKKYSLNTLAQDIAELTSKLGHSQVSVMGVSMGGMIAMELAIQFPKLVKKLIIANSMRRLKIEKPWRQNFRNLANIYTKNQRIRKAPLFLNLIFTPKFLNEAPDAEWKKILSAFSTDRIKNRHGILQLKSILAWKRSSSDFRNISCPSLVLCADQDILCPPQNSLEIVKDLWNTQYVRFKNLGHAMIYEGLSQIIPPIDRFLEQPSLDHSKITLDKAVGRAD
jgi:pimeloyl-ACP methyl ester carboxylesterase